MDVVSFRPFDKTDLNFIQHSWGSSYYKGAEYLEFISPSEFNHKHRPIRERLLSSPTATVIIACNKQDPDQILGWILVEKTKDPGIILHFIYVKEAYKGEGIFEALMKKGLPERPVLVTHMTDKGRKIIKKKTETFKDFKFSKNTIMVRDKYLSALPMERPDDED